MQKIRESLSFRVWHGDKPINPTVWWSDLRKSNQPFQIRRQTSSNTLVVFLVATLSQWLVAFFLIL